MPKKRLKIGVVIDQLLPGGVQIAAIEEVKNLRLAGHQAQLLILMRKKYSFQFQYLVRDLPYRYLSDSYPWPFRNTIKFPWFSFFSTLHLLSPFLAPRVIKERAFDILISHGTTTCFTTLALWHKRKIPYLAVIHDPITFILKKVYSKTFLKVLFPFFIPLSYFLEKSFVKDSLATIVDSDVHQKFIQDKYGTAPVVLPLGCNVEKNIPPKRGGAILAVSRWQKEKKPAFLLKILKEIPRAKLIIAGVWTRKEDLDLFKKEAKELGVQSRLKIIPQFKSADLEKLFGEARVWVHPNFEAFGMGGLEAASFGCPIIIPEGSGITNLFRNGIDGFFPKETSLSEYKKYLKKLLADERLAYGMGKNAWQRAKDEYSWQAHTQKLFSLTEKCLTFLALAKITALEIGHAGGTGLSGGDKLFEEMAKKMPGKFNLEVITSPFGANHWQESNLKVNLKILKENYFEEKSHPIAVFSSYIIRIIQSSLYLFTKSEKIETLYSSTNILPDILPAFFAKLKNPKISWIARIHHLIPLPHQREGKLLVNTVSFLMQKLALFCMATKADLIIALNETLFQELLKRKFPPKKLTVLGAGIDFVQISQYQPKREFRIDGIYLGRLHVTKGVFDTIDIWEEVIKKKKRAKLAIVGTGPELIINQLQNKIAERGLTKNINILGYLPENQVLDFLKSAKTFLFTDHEAGWGLAIAEAMACGLPVVGYDIGVLGNVFKKGFKTVPLGNTQTFGQEIVQLLENKGKREKLAKEAFVQANSLDWKKTTAKFVRIIGARRSPAQDEPQGELDPART